MQIESFKILESVYYYFSYCGPNDLNEETSHDGDKSRQKDSCRFVKRYNGETDCVERWIGAPGKAKENAKPGSIVAASHVRS